MTGFNFEERLQASDTLDTWTETWNGLCDVSLLNLYSSGRIFSNFELFECFRLGRCESIDDVTIIGKLDFNQIRCSEKALEESQRLDVRAAKCNEIERNRFQNHYLTVCYVNIQSLKAHVQDLLRDRHVNQCDAIGLGETWLKDGEKIDSFEGRRNLHIQQGEGKGLSCVFKDIQPSYAIAFGQDSTYAFIMFKLKTYHFIFGYISPKAKFKNYADDLHELIKIGKNEPCIFMGDANVPATQSTHPFMVQMRAGGFKQIVTDVTHDGGNILDAVFINQFVSPEKICLYQKPVIFSDHDILFVSIKKDH